MIAVRQLTSAAEVFANAAAVRARLYGAKPRPTNAAATPAEKITVITPPRRYAPPRDYNAHVIVYRKWMLYQELRSQFDQQVCDFQPEERQKTAYSVIHDVLSFFPGVTMDQLRGQRRQADLIVVRHIAEFEVCRQFPAYSLPMVGRIFCKDHTSVLSAKEKIAKLGGVNYVRKQFIKSLRRHRYGKAEIDRMIGEYAW